VRAARLHAARDIRIGETARAASVPPGHCRVRVTAVGLCGSDLHWFTEGAIGDAVLADPLVLGHELAGVVVEGELDGTTVGIDPAIPCGRCLLCRQALEHLCPTGRFAGHGITDGGLQEELVWPAELLHPLPAGYDPAQATLLEPLGVAVHSVDLAHLRPGGTVGVVGCGPIGLLLVQLAARVAARVVAVEPLVHRQDAALRSGATVALHPDELAEPSAGGELWLDGCEAVFEVSGTDAGLATAGHLARPGGRVLLVGIPDADSTTFSASLFRRKGLTLAAVRRMTADAYARGVALALGGTVDVSWLTSHRFPLADAGQAFIVAADRAGLKVVVEIG
jgi:L-iditol 2-dehydrogenase